MLTDKLQYIPVDAVTLEQAKAQALKERPDLEAQQEREATARLSASATKMERLPTVAAFGDYGSSGTWIDNALPTRTIGISVRVPLFDGGRREARRAESESQYRVGEGEDQRSEGADRTGCAAGAGRAALGGRAGEGGAGKGWNWRRTSWRRRGGGTRPGWRSGVEVTDAQTRLERARDNQTAALYNYNVGRIDLAQAMGAVRKSVE